MLIEIIIQTNMSPERARFISDIDKDDVKAEAILRMNHLIDMRIEATYANTKEKV